MSRPLRIAILAPITGRAVSRQHGAGELVAKALSDGMVERGYEVTLFAAADAVTKATLKSVYPPATTDDASSDPAIWETLHVANCFEHANSFDIIHNFCGVLPLAFSRFVMTPIVTVAESPSAAELLMYERFQRRVHLIAAGENDRDPALKYTATVRHGIAMDGFPLQSLSEGYLLCFGDIGPDKGVRQAISLARTVRRRLVIAGNAKDRRFFADEIQPQLDGLIEYIGPIDSQHRADVIGGAAVFLQLGKSAEPFALSAIQAMACGTPVIARALGSMKDVVLPGENGFLVADTSEAADALAKCLRLNRSTVRASVEARYDHHRMIDEYAALYREIAKTDRRSAPGRRNGGSQRMIVPDPPAAARAR